MALPLTTRARAKVNLDLRVLGRRADGYHELDSLVAFADVGDRLTVAAAADGPHLAITGPFAAPLLAELARRHLIAVTAVTLEEEPHAADPDHD